jgi:hypothetical protein
MNPVVPQSFLIKISTENFHKQLSLSKAKRYDDKKSGAAFLSDDKTIHG